MDLISREKLLNEIDTYCKANCKYTEAEQDVMCRACMVDDIKDMVERLPSSNQWIPVSERLPKENKDDLHNFLFSDVVMVTVYDTERDIVMGVNCDMTIDGKWQGYQSCDGTEVIAWQPLPEPYKTESEDK